MEQPERPNPRGQRSAPGATPSRATPPTTHAPGSAPRRGAQWFSLSESVSVASVTIPGGVYVGAQLDAVSPMMGTEPALIVPRLPVNHRRPDVYGQQMDYWPSYSEIPPDARAAYLQWHAAGRPGGAYIGYVFLFFYGIERRVLVDASEPGAAVAEVPQLLAEVERLLSLYGHNGSFSSYATDFLATARIVHTTHSISDLEPPRERVGWDIPFEVKLAVGARAAANEPIPGEWALAWALTNPQIRLRTPATRCPEEFADLFLTRYAATYGDGMLLKPNKTRLRLGYRPASASFSGMEIAVDAGDVPDLTGLTTPTKKLAELVESVTTDLDAFSRHVGRHEERDSARAVALLPPELARRRMPPKLEQILADVGDGHQVVKSAQLAGLLGDEPAGKLGKRDTVAIASLLAAHGIGVEPDVRFGPSNFSHHEQALLWRDEDPGAPPGDGFAAATVLLHFGVAVSASDGEITAAEEQHLESGLEEALDLPEPGRRRLRAHLRWLLAERPGVAGVKARIGALDDGRRAMIARYLLAVAGADGHVSPKEVDVLRRLYGLLGLDPESVHRDLHDLAAAGPVPVVPADADTGDYAIAREVLLDRDRLSAVMTSTKQVSEVLTAVFAEPEPAEAPTPPDDPRADDGVAGLDPAHSLLLHRLAARPTWPRSDLEAAATDAGLLAAGAIETINEAAFAVSDGPLLEGHDPVELDGHILKEILDG